MQSSHADAMSVKCAITLLFQFYPFCNCFGVKAEFFLVVKLKPRFMSVKLLIYADVPFSCSLVINDRIMKH